MKTVLITSFHPLISRNILGTQFLDRLQERGIRIVLLVPQKKKAFFEKEFEEKGVVIEGILNILSWRDKLARYFSLAALNTTSLKIKRKTEMRGSGELLTLFIGNSVFGRRLVRLVSILLTPKHTFHHLFERYRPSAVFATDVQNEFDVRLMHEARDHKTRTIGMVRSWDNLTAKGLLRIIPDVLVTHNDIERKEAMKLNAVPEARIRIVGIPHYDRYFSGKRSSRKEFFKKIGADPKKRLVLFAPVGDRYLPNNTLDRDIVDILDKTLDRSLQILVRFPPMDTVRFLDGHENEGRIIFDRPARSFRTPKNAELSSEDDEHLADTLFHADLVIAGPSTVSIDAAFFDKPVVLVGFDGYQSRPYYESVRRYFDYNHWGPILKTGGVKLAENREEFITFIKEYLLHPEKDQLGRKKVVEEQVVFRDGKSSERLASLIFSMTQG